MSNIKLLQTLRQCHPDDFFFLAYLQKLSGVEIDYLKLKSGPQKAKSLGAVELCFFFLKILHWRTKSIQLESNSILDIPTSVRKKGDKKITRSPRIVVLVKRCVLKDLKHNKTLQRDIYKSGSVFFLPAPPLCFWQSAQRRDTASSNVVTFQNRFSKLYWLKIFLSWKLQ